MQRVRPATADELHNAVQEHLDIIDKRVELAVVQVEYTQALMNALSKLATTRFFVILSAIFFTYASIVLIITLRT